MIEKPVTDASGCHAFNFEAHCLSASNAEIIVAAFPEISLLVDTSNADGVDVSLKAQEFWYRLRRSKV